MRHPRAVVAGHSVVAVQGERAVWPCGGIHTGALAASVGLRPAGRVAPQERGAAWVDVSRNSSIIITTTTITIF